MLSTPITTAIANMRLYFSVWKRITSRESAHGGLVRFHDCRGDVDEPAFTSRWSAGQLPIRFFKVEQVVKGTGSYTSYDIVGPEWGLLYNRSTTIC